MISYKESINTNRFGESMNNIMVSICCTAYNHEKYISDAIDSFLMQKTNFEFEILIHDDASTDKTAEIIREYEKKYPSIIKPIYQIENKYSKGIEIVYTYNFTRAKGKYIAMCEGDDYWIDPYKLQKQFEYMENNPECSLCVHSAKRVTVEKKDIGVVRANNGNKSYTVDEIILGGGGMFATNSMLFPTILAKNVPDFYLKCPVGDYPLTIYLSLKGEVYYIDSLMSAYRVMTENSWTQKMQGNLQKHIQHIKLIEKMLNEVDEYSNFIHSKSIKEHIVKNQFNMKIMEGKFKEARNGEYREYYKSLNIKSKFKLIIKQYCSGIIPVLLKIKEMLYR